MDVAFAQSCCWRARQRHSYIPDKATLYMPQGRGGEQEDFCTWKLTDVLVSSYQVGSHAGGGSEILPVDQFSLNFGKIKVMEYCGEQDEKPARSASRSRRSQGTSRRQSGKAE